MMIVRSGNVRREYRGSLPYREEVSRVIEPSTDALHELVEVVSPVFHYFVHNFLVLPADAGRKFLLPPGMIAKRSGYDWYSNVNIVPVLLRGGPCEPKGD